MTLPKVVLKYKNNHIFNSPDSFESRKISYKCMVKAIQKYYETLMSLDISLDVMTNLRKRIIANNRANNLDWLANKYNYCRIAILRKHAIKVLDGEYTKDISSLLSNLIGIFHSDKMNSNNFDKITDYKPYIKPRTYYAYARVCNDYDEMHKDKDYTLIDKFNLTCKGFGVNYRIKVHLRHLKELLSSFHAEYDRALQ